MDSVDWQTACPEIRDRGAYLLKTGKWADCHFLVGSENNQQLLSGHKLILAMSSPVFDAMFNGTLAEKNDPISITDVRPDAFIALMEYIYTDRIEITSMDKACELCYVAKKYMLPVVVQRCTEFLWSDLNSKNVCRAFEFAKLFEEPDLAERCLQIICSHTNDVISHPSFEDVELSTVMTILDQDFLHIDSELDLFLALVRYAEKHGHGKLISKEEAEMIDVDAGEGTSIQQPNDTPRSDLPTFRDALRKIRFLLLSNRQFAEHVPKTKLLSTSESFAILMNISSSHVHPMPDSFSTSRKSRSISPAIPSSNTNLISVYSESSNDAPVFSVVGSQTLINNHNHPYSSHSPMGFFHVRSRNPTNRYRGHHSQTSGRDHMMDASERRFYCIRPIRDQIDYFNTSVSDCALTFTVDRAICITGIQVSTQVLGVGEQNSQSGNIPERYSELLYAHLLDSFGTRMTYTHCTSNVRFDSLLEISFDRPVQIHRDRPYKIGVGFNKTGWYPMCSCAPSVQCEGVTFDFRVDGSNGESLRDGLIRSIVFHHLPDNN